MGLLARLQTLPKYLEIMVFGICRGKSEAKETPIGGKEEECRISYKGTTKAPQILKVVFFCRGKGCSYSLW